jgi:hypothetical protein
VKRPARAGRAYCNLLASVAALHTLQLSGEGAWLYPPSLGTLPAWLPFQAVRTSI